MERVLPQSATATASAQNNSSVVLNKVHFLKASQKRNQVWVMVNGRKNFINCDSSQLFFAGGEGSTAEIGLDVQADSSILIAYSAVRTVAEGKSVFGVA
jgi:hypothetical protein